MKYSYLFGPVPSRRLGTSLGIDLTPTKTCSFNCVYCECGRTINLTLDRKEYVATQDVIAELRDFFSTEQKIDYITFSGSGEPTLHSGIGEIIAFIKKSFPRYKVAVMTNSSLLYLQSVRTALMQADLVIPSLDAVSDHTFRLITRAPREINVDFILEGLRIFSKEYRGEIWLEIFIVPGVNDTREELELIKREIQKLHVSRVQLNTLDRPGVVKWVVPATPKHLQDIAAYLGDRVESVASRRSKKLHRELDASTRDLIISTLSVNPKTVAELAEQFTLPQVELFQYLDELTAVDRIQTRITEKGTVYLVKIGKHFAQ